MKPMQLQPSRGFTLLELLVALSVTSLIALAMGGALRTMAQAETTLAQRTAEVDETRLGRQLLQQALSVVVAPSTNGPDGPVLPFLAAPDRLEWIGVMPARPGMAGRHFFRLMLEGAGGEAPALVLRFAPWAPDAPAPDWTSTPSRILLSSVSSFGVQASGLPPRGRTHPVPWPVGWQEGWAIPDRLPQWLRLVWVDERGIPHHWTEPVRASISNDDSLTLVTVGGGLVR